MHVLLTACHACRWELTLRALWCKKQLARWQQPISMLRTPSASPCKIGVGCKGAQRLVKLAQAAKAFLLASSFMGILQLLQLNSQASFQHNHSIGQQFSVRFHTSCCMGTSQLLQQHSQACFWHNSSAIHQITVYALLHIKLGLHQEVAGCHPKHTAA